MESEIRIVAIGADGIKKEYSVPRSPKPQASINLAQQNSETKPHTLFTSIGRDEQKEYRESAGYKA